MYMEYVRLEIRDDPLDKTAVKVLCILTTFMHIMFLGTWSVGKYQT